MSQVPHQAGAYPGFCSMKRLGVFLAYQGYRNKPKDMLQCYKLLGLMWSYFTLLAVQEQPVLSLKGHHQPECALQHLCYGY